MEVEGAGLAPRRRPLSTAIQAGDASSGSWNWKRARFLPPSRILFEDDSDDDDDDRDRFEAVNEDGRHGQDDEENAADDGDEEEVVGDDEGEQQIEGETEYIYSPLDAYYAGDADQDQQEQPQQGGGGEDQPLQPPADEEEDSDDDRPIRFVRRGGGEDQPPAEEEDGDENHRPIRLVRRPICVVRRRSTAPGQAPAPALAPAVAPPAPQEPSSCSDSPSVIRDATVENTGVDCGICYLPLKPPIFQCNVGHVVCSRCSDKLGEATNCHKCRAPTPGGYRRCYDMEQLVDAIHVPCPHAAYGCAYKPVYHAREAHALSCPHAPTCHCPGEACGFAGTTAALLDHFAAVHSDWPCITEDGDGGCFYVLLRDGFNFITGGVRGGAANKKYLFLLKVKREPPLGRTITAFCIHPDRTATAKLRIICRRRYMCDDDTCNVHVQSSEFKVVCTDLSNGLPDPSSSNCFLFVVPGSGREEEDATTSVIVDITPPSIQ